MRALALPFALVIASTLLACPPDDKKTPTPSPLTPAGPKACEKLGQSCEFSPGKLGTCVQRDDFKTGTCFDCQSQH